MTRGLKIANLALTRGERSLFSDLCLDVEEGQAIALSGANGAGKTSLLRAIAGFIRPDSGVISFVISNSVIENDEFRSRQIHLLGHQEALKPARSARQELMFQVDYLGGSKARADEAIAQLKLEPLLDLETRKLSAGQKRRLSFARLMAAPRALWLLDEPLAPLDDVWRQRMGTIMQAHLSGGGMIVAAVHDPLPIEAISFDLGGRA